MCARSLLPNEMVMQVAWRFRLWSSCRAVTADGERVEVVSPGVLNTGAGPDFMDARVRIGNILWAGAVEIHVRASDWYRHGHDDDRAYDGVVLHVVALDDDRIRRHDGTVVPQIVMDVADEFAPCFNRLLHERSLVLPACGEELGDVARVYVADWLSALGVERLQRKAEDVVKRLSSSTDDWRQTVYETLARGLGFGTNAQAMEWLARTTPLKHLLKHTDDADAIIAILLGQAGLIDKEHPADDYERRLAADYDFYARKYGLDPAGRPVWARAGRNAGNTPWRRIALLGALIVGGKCNFGMEMCETTDIDAARQFFDVDVPLYWQSHSTFGMPLTGRPAALGRGNTDLLIINVIVPLLYVRGMEQRRYELQDAAVDILEHIRAEENSITRGFADYGIKARDAFASQALVQLHREYCERRRCLECRLGAKLLSRHIVFAGYSGAF